MSKPDKLEMLREAGRLFETLRREGDPRVKLDIALDTTLRNTGASCAYVLIDYGTGGLEVFLARKHGAPMPVDEGCQKAIATRVKAKGSDDSFVIVPLASAGKRSGYIVVEYLTPGTGDTEKVVEAFVPYAVHAVELIRSGETDREARETGDELQGADLFPSLVGDSSGMVYLKARLDKFRLVDASVLVTGETGTGKELVARALHETGPRRRRPFVAFNVAAVSETLAESELFGHVKGAFTGAIDARPGLFQQAHGGTLFIDEVGDASPAMQAKLLRAIETKTVRRVGATEDEKVSVRIVAATHHDLEAAVREKRFREDLYYRLNVLGVHLPALRQRMGDLKPLIAHLLAHAAAERREKPRRLTDEAFARLQRHHWPGNVRELRDAIERALTLGGDPLRPEDFELEPTRPAAAPGGERPALTPDSLRRVLRETRGDLEATGAYFRVHSMTIRRRIDQWKLERGR